MIEKKMKTGTARAFIPALLLSLLLSAAAFAANNPGHDTLYIEQNGSSNLTGGLNISEWLRVGNLFYTTWLDIQGNGTPPGNSRAEIYGASGNKLYVNAPGNLFLLSGAGSMVYVTGSVNASNNIYADGAIYSGGQLVCLANGTNCISGTNTGNVSSVTAGNGLTGGGTGEVTLNVGAGNGITANANDIAIDPTYTQRRVTGTCAAGTAIDTINEDGTVGCEATSGVSSAAGWRNTSTTTSTLLNVNITSANNNAAVVVRGASGQAYNLIEWRNSSDYPLAAVNGTGWLKINGYCNEDGVGSKARGLNFDDKVKIFIDANSVLYFRVGSNTRGLFSNGKWLGWPYASSNLPTFSFYGDTNTGVAAWSTGDKLSLMTGGVHRLTVNTAGKVGVGNTEPNKTLEVTGDVKADNYYAGSTAGLTGNYTIMDDDSTKCWLQFTSGLLTATNCTT